MCGISGIFNWNKKEEISRNILDNMLENQILNRKRWRIIN